MPGQAAKAPTAPAHSVPGTSPCSPHSPFNSNPLSQAVLSKLANIYCPPPSKHSMPFALLSPDPHFFCRSLSPNLLPRCLEHLHHYSMARGPITPHPHPTKPIPGAPASPPHQLHSLPPHHHSRESQTPSGDFLCFPKQTEVGRWRQRCEDALEQRGCAKGGAEGWQGRG